MESTNLSETVIPLNSVNEARVTTRAAVQDRLGLAQTVALDPSAVFCIEPFSSLTNGNAQRLGNLLARVMANPDRALVVATGEAFVFAFV